MKQALLETNWDFFGQFIYDYKMFINCLLTGIKVGLW
jgi:hypothetical protein